jgi:hypothetical protein
MVWGRQEASSADCCRTENHSNTFFTSRAAICEDNDVLGFILELCGFLEAAQSGCTFSHLRREHDSCCFRINKAILEQNRRQVVERQPWFHGTGGPGRSCP